MVTDAAMADALFDYFNSIIGTNFERSRNINLAAIGVPAMELSALEALFTEEEVRSVIVELPSDKAPGPDGFTGLFYKKTWEIIKDDILIALNAFWSRDRRSFNHLNDAFMILLRKKDHPLEIRDYQPISLIHSFSKLVTKCLAKRLAPMLDDLVMKNQSALIRGRCIHDNFRQVQLACKAIDARRTRGCSAKNRHCQSLRYSVMDIPSGRVASHGFRAAVAGLDIRHPVYIQHQNAPQRPAGQENLPCAWSPAG